MTLYRLRVNAQPVIVWLPHDNPITFMNYDQLLQLFSAQHPGGAYAAIPYGQDPYPCVVVDFNGVALVVSDISSDGTNQVVCSSSVLIPGAWQALVDGWCKR